MRAGKAVVELRIALAQTIATCVRELCVPKAHLGEEAQTLEDRAVAELLRVADQEVAVVGLRPPMRAETVGDMVDSAFGLGRVRSGGC